MSDTGSIKYSRKSPKGPLMDFIDCFWKLENDDDTDKLVTILPDGYFDVLFTSVKGSTYKVMLFGLSTKPAHYVVPAKSCTYSISFKLIAAEYVLKHSVKQLLDTFEYLPDHSSWLNLQTTNLDEFSSSAAAFISKAITEVENDRMLILSREIYNLKGAVTVKRLEEITSWKSRQINRYFHKFFGLSLKSYCNILRFRASFERLYNGELFPDDSYYDQSHFIREVEKFSATTPRQLSKNTDDRFIQLTTLGAS